MRGGCSPGYIRLQPWLHTVAALVHTVAGLVTYGCSPGHIRLQGGAVEGLSESVSAEEAEALAEVRR